MSRLIKFWLNNTVSKDNLAYLLKRRLLLSFHRQYSNVPSLKEVRVTSFNYYDYV